MNSNERKYGYIIFPETGRKIENVWLNITEKEIFLEAAFDLNSESNFPIVLGIFNGLSNVTFIDVFTSGGSRGGGGSVRKLVVSWMIKNKHIQTIDNLKFKSISFNEFALKEWYREDFYVESQDFVYTVPKPIQPLSTQTNDFKLVWELAHRINSNSHDVEIRLTSSIITKFNEDKSWDFIIEHILKVKKLLIFLTNKDPQFENIDLGDYAELVFRINPLYESRFPTHLRLSYEEIKPLLPEIVNLWFEEKKLEPITDLVLEKHFQDGIPSHRHFFNLAVGLEAFHENFILKKVPLSDNSILANKELIINAINSNGNLKKWFNTISSNWTKPSLKDRLIHMQNTISQVSNGVFEMETILLITKIVKTRNDIAHAGIYDKQFNEDIQLRIVTKIIEFVLRLEIYKMMNITWKTQRTDLISQANKLVKQLATLNDFKLVESK